MPGRGQTSATFATPHTSTTGRINDQTFWLQSSVNAPELFEPAKKN
jgi:hypothetical protein